MFIKLNKEYKEEIIYETMIKMGFLYCGNSSYYYNSKGIQYNGNYNVRKYNSAISIYLGLFLSFYKNNILAIDGGADWLYFSEFLARHNITKLTDIEPSSLIDVEYKERVYSNSFEGLSNIEQKVLITFIEEFDRVYNSIGSK